MPIDVLYDNHMCVLVYYCYFHIYLNNTCGIRKPMLLRALNLESFINVDFLSFLLSLLLKCGAHVFL